MDRIEALAADIARLGSESERHASTARSLTDELAKLRGRVDMHTAELSTLSDTVSRVHALTREIRASQEGFAGDTVAHVMSLHRAVLAHSGDTKAQNVMLDEISRGVSDVLARNDSQRIVLDTVKRWRAWGGILFAIVAVLSGVVAAHWR